MSVEAAYAPASAGWYVGTGATAPNVPSGQHVELFEVLVDQVGAEAWLRFRFLAPSIGKSQGDLSFEQTFNDFGYLCDEVALPYIAEYALVADVIVISLLDRPVEFGASDPEATQYIEAFRSAGSECEMEGDW